MAEPRMADARPAEPRPTEPLADGLSPARHPAAGLRMAYLLSAAAALLMAAASAAGVWVAGLYPDIPWAGQALRGGDLVTLAVVVPVLVLALLASAAGSQRAQLVWAGALGYAIYNYAYVVFGADFNDWFLAHIAILIMSIWALISLLSNLDRDPIVARFGPRTPARSVAVLFGMVTLGLAGLWGYFILRQVITGQLPGGAAPPTALHLIYSTDLVIFVSPLAVAAVLLWRRTPWGYLLGAVMAVTGATYLINLMSAAVFQASAHVEGVAAFSPFSLVLDLTFVAAAIAMLATMTGRVPSRRR